MIPELLAPAGNLDKLKIAYKYGADAVYVGGVRFGLRSGADNFSNEDLAVAAKFAHDHGKKLYVTLNAFLHNQDMEGLGEFVAYLETIGIDALIVSDLGVVTEVTQYCNIPVHLSTQASCLNVSSAKVWKALGVERVIVGRELTVEETSTIKREAGMEVEMFIHGAMCSAYSGNCTISNYTAGRDSNRGGCKQSCRFDYSMESSEEDLTFMSSKDLMGINYLPEFIESEIDSVKIEGRMKSELYVAITCKSYRTAIDASVAGGFEKTAAWEEELNRAPNRGFTEASLRKEAEDDSISRVFKENPNKYNFLGTVLDVDFGKMFIHLKNPIRKGEKIEIMTFLGENKVCQFDQMSDYVGNNIEAGRQNQIIVVDPVEGVLSGMVVRAFIEGVAV